MNNYDAKAQRRLLAKLSIQSNGCMIFNGSGCDETRRVRFRKWSVKHGVVDRMALDPLRFHYRDKLISPKAVAYGLANGINPFEVRKPLNTCGNRLCCNADHLVVCAIDPKFALLEAMGFSADMGLSAEDMNQMSELVFTDADLERYIALA